MNYKKSVLIKDIAQTPNIIKLFDIKRGEVIFKKLRSFKKIIFTGEGSSRIFPAKNAIYKARTIGLKKDIFSYGCYEVLKLDLKDAAIFGASNSGKTKELVFLFEKLKDKKIPTIGISVNEDSPVLKLSWCSYILSCGIEKAVAATKSVIEEALFYDSFIAYLAKTNFAVFLRKLYAAAVKTPKTEPSITELALNAPTIYFVGPPNGVAEELSIKSIEITRKKSFFIEGTGLFHGFEEIFKPQELVVLIEPYPEEEKNYTRLIKETGVNIVAISEKKTLFPTILVEADKDIKGYLELMAGWNFLVDIGIKLGVNIDKPKRARKVGNPMET